jgi:hypothetical protein
MREEIPFPDRVLQTLHNLCGTAADLAWKSDELAKFMQKDTNEVESVLDKYKSEGFTENFVDPNGNKWYYLKAKGIIKVCSLFT